MCSVMHYAFGQVGSTRLRVTIQTFKLGRREEKYPAIHVPSGKMEGAKLVESFLYLSLSYPATCSPSSLLPYEFTSTVSGPELGLRESE